MDKISVARLGIVEYSLMANQMKMLQKLRIEERVPDILIFVQHPEVVTMGPKALRDEVVVDGYPTIETDRGGGATWHGPGQLVAYPIVKWGVEEQSIRGIIGRLEDWAIEALSRCGVRAYKDPVMQGAWVDGHKICSIGLSFLHWVSRHGMSINIDTPDTRVEDLEGCGIEAGMHTSLAKLGYTMDSEGRKINSERIQSELLSVCERHLGRVPEEGNFPLEEVWL